MSYSVQVTVTSSGGATTYAETVPQGDDTRGNVAAAYGLADPLIIKQKLADGPRLPLSQPEPDEATFTLIAANATTYQEMALGDPVGILVYPQASYAGTPVSFYGRIAAMTAEPHKLGVKISVSCVDYTADLAELRVGATAWASETCLQRVQRIFDECNLGTMTKATPAWTITSTPTVAARAAGVTDAYSALVDTLDSWYTHTFKDEYHTLIAGSPDHSFTFRPWVVQKITSGQLDPTNPFQLGAGAPWSRRVNYAPPGRISNLAGVYTVTMDAANSSPTTGAPIIDAGKVEFAPVFTRDKLGQLPNVTVGMDAVNGRYVWDWRAEIGWAAGGGTLGPGGWKPFTPALEPRGPVLLQEVDSILDDSDSPLVGSPSIAQLYRVPYRPDVRATWQVGTLSWQLWSETTWSRPNLTELLTVARCQTGKLPSNREWVSGLVRATTLTIQKGRPVLDVEVVPPSYDYELDRFVRGASLGVVSFDSPILGTIQLGQLNTRDTLEDYALVRGS